MTDLGGLAAVALILYLWECAVWVPDGAEAFRVPLRGRWRLARESWLQERPRGRVVLGSPLPTLGVTARCEARPPRLSPHGICGCARGDAGSGPPARWEDLVEIRAQGRRVVSGDRILWTAGTRRYAAHLADLAERARTAPAPERAALLERELARLADHRAVRREVLGFRRSVRSLRRTAWVLSVAVAALVFAAAIERALVVVIVPLVWGLAGLTSAIYARLRRRVGPGSVGEHVLAMVLLPLAALRADDQLARETFATYHALAVARGAHVAPPWVRPGETPDLEGGSRGQDGASAVPCCEAGAWVEHTWRIVTSACAPSARPAPRRDSADAMSHCPRCHQQYARTGRCSDCENVSLVPFAS